MSFRFPAFTFRGAAFVICTWSALCAESFTFNDWMVAPLRVHLLSATNAPAIHTTLSEDDVRRVLGKVNTVWSQAGISFWVESIVHEQAVNTSEADKVASANDLHHLLKLRPDLTKATNLLHLYYVKKLPVNGVYLGEAMFVKDTATLRAVAGGIDEPIPRVSSHEIGHALTLQHCADETHLMYRGTTGTNLDEVEIKQAREAASKLACFKPAPTVAKEAAQAGRNRRMQHARFLHSQIAIIPLDHRAIRRARRQMTTSPSVP